MQKSAVVIDAKIQVLAKVKRIEEKCQYIQLRNRVNTDRKNMKRECWERFAIEMERDLYETKEKI